MHRPHFNSNWELGATIATSRNSVVRIGNIYRDGLPTPVAVKSAPTSRSLSLQKEKDILRSLRGSPEIIRCYFADVSFDPKTDEEEFYHLFLELSPHGSLSDVTALLGPLHEPQIRSYTKSILLGLYHIHSKGYVHCDIKTSNILVWNYEDVKIADFGLAKWTREPVKGIRGTLPYIAPESFLREEYEEGVDVWALGLVVIEMASGKPAWKFPGGKEGVKEAMQVIGRSDKLPKIPEGLSDMGKDFVRKCVIKDPEVRWTVEMLLEHAFVSDSGHESDSGEEEGELDLELSLGWPF